MINVIFSLSLLFVCLWNSAVAANNPPPARPLKNIQVALVLGGGGARSVAQAGVIDVLEENHIPVELIVGSSAGSLIGALYADNPNSHDLRRKVLPLKKWDLLDIKWWAGFKMFWNISGPVQGNALKDFVRDHIRATNFSQLKIPLVVVTTDVNKGEAFVISSGPLAPALHASCAIPMLFSPVTLYGRLLVDGGVVSPVPVEIAKEFSPKIIIAVDIGTSPDNGNVSSTAHLLYRSLHISYNQLSYWQNKQADIVIHPDIDEFSMFTDAHNEKMYRAGREAALAALPLIKAKLN